MNRKSLAFAVAVASVSWLHASFVWKQAADGDWVDGDNWLEGRMPSYADNENVYLTNNAAAYTVGLSNAVNQTIWGLRIAGSGSGENRTTLTVENSSLKVTNGRIVATNGEIRVGNKGVLEIENGHLGGATVLQKGGRIVVDGGTLVATNNFKQLYLDSAETNGGDYPLLKIVSGNAYMKYINGVSESLLIRVLNYAKLEMSGGVMTLESEYNKAVTLLNFSAYNNSNHYMELSGDACLKVLNGGAAFGRGIMTLEDNSSFELTGYDKHHCAFQPYISDNSQTTQYNFKDNSAFKVVDAKFYFGKTDARTKGTVGTFNISGGNHSFGRYCELGCGRGLFTTTITGGHTEFRQYGLRIGAYPSTAASTDKDGAFAYTCTGIVNVVSGVLYLNPGECHANSARDELWGTVIGYGTSDNRFSGWFDGRLNISGDGIVTNNAAPIVVGGGKSVGTIVQNGGVFHSIAEGNGFSYWNRSSLVLGLCGGNGSYLMTGGIAECHNAMYVGGIDFDTFGRTEAKNNSKLPSNDGSSVGLLDISGGSFTAGKSLFVGVLGKGTVHVSGAGSLTVGRSLVLSNSVENAATLKLTLVGNTPPSVKIADKLVVREGAKLVVDATDFTGTQVWTKLVSCGSRTGSFSAGDITVIGGEDVRGSLVFNKSADSTGSIWWYRPKGTAVVIR